MRFLTPASAQERSRRLRLSCQQGVRFRVHEGSDRTGPGSASGLGLCQGTVRRNVMKTVFEALLFVRSPHLSDLKLNSLEALIARRRQRAGSQCAVALSRVLASMGTVPEVMKIKRPVQGKRASLALTLGVPAEWMRLCTLWYDRSVYARRSRAMSFYFLLNVGRWLGHTHPEVTSPADWNRDLACEVVSVLCQWHGGDWCSVDPAHVTSRGKILAPSTRPAVSARFASSFVTFRSGS